MILGEKYKSLRYFFKLLYKQEAVFKELNEVFLYNADSRNLPIRGEIQEQKEAIQTNLVRKSYLVSFLKILVLATVIGFIVYLVDNNVIAGNWQIIVTRLLGSILIASAVLGRIGYDIQTYGGTTKPEKINTRCFRVLYYIGLAILLFSILIT